MTGKGKYAFVITVTAPVIVGVVVVPAVPVDVIVVPVDVVDPPNTTAPVAAEPVVTVPVQNAPVGQHAIFRELSSVQTLPAVQHAPPSAAASVEQELKLTGQLPSLFSRSWTETAVSFARDWVSKKSANIEGIWSADAGRRNSGRKSDRIVLLSLCLLFDSGKYPADNWFASYELVSL